MTIDPTLADQRTSYDQLIHRDLPAGVTTRTTTLGGRPALEIRTGATGGTLLFLHGGGYRLGSPAAYAGFTTAIARQTGTEAVAPDYRLAPEHPFPAATDDALAAYRELVRNVHPSRLVIGGDSAGGGLTIATLVGARDAGLPLPAAAFVFSPYADLTHSGESMRTRVGIDPIFTPEALATLGALYTSDPHDPRASVWTADLRGLPPLLIQVGSSELLLDDAVRLAARAAADDVDVTLEVTARAPHVFQNRFGDGGPADAALENVGRFVRRHLTVRR
ncbi:alpha/beta hydrolase [Kineosporia succinea]|uniref:Acetyl esterase/lipase n=1 Tax=Kineosporia succinea TaxID=84632 RepID=A0ABT9PA60_9ACTN|nr:alpha/beta hydrolase [Kineosporia succinea]MDP9828920.1 acetyl esterase/lipase [Kineosporia succinea]